MQAIKHSGYILSAFVNNGILFKLKVKAGSSSVLILAPIAGLSVSVLSFLALEVCPGHPEKVETWGPLQLGQVGVIFFTFKGAVRAEVGARANHKFWGKLAVY